jgi:predicted transcriptional regulator
MILPQELEVFYVIPAIRRELAMALVSKGLKQKQVAKIFGVTEACISNYFKAKRGKNVQFNPKIMKTIKECASEIKQGKTCFIKTVQEICKQFKQNKCLCALHERLDAHVCGCKGCL